MESEGQGPIVPSGDWCKTWPHNFLAHLYQDDAEDRDATVGKYIVFLHTLLWEVVRVHHPGADGRLDDYIPTLVNDLQTDRDRLAERVKELEAWIDRGESNILHATRQSNAELSRRLAIAEADKEALVKTIDKICLKSYEPDPERPALSTRSEIQLIAEAALAISHPGTAITQRLAEMERRYNELLYAVGNKYENESRHETALRYIHEREQPKTNEPVKQALDVEEK